MKDTFYIQDELFDAFSTDENLCKLLEIEGLDVMHDEDKFELLNNKIRREDMMPEVYSEDLLDFVALYFIDADASSNYLVNSALMRIDIYAKYRGVVGDIRRSIVDILHKHGFRIVAEGQKQSGIQNVYKYRLEILPLVSS